MSHWERNLRIGFCGLGKRQRTYSSPPPLLSPIPGAFQNPSPRLSPLPPPAAPRPPPLPGSDITGRPGGVRRRWARARVPRAEEAAAAAAEAAAAAAAGAEEEAPDAAQEPGTPECPRPERSAPEAVRGRRGDVSRGGGRFGVWARRGVDLGRPGPDGERGPRTGPLCVRPHGLGMCR